MRKHQHLLLAAIMGSLFSAFSSHAQNTSPYWSLVGNSNASTSSKLGTTTAIPLRLMTNNTVRVYISPSAGYVGVGTTSPTERLHINSAAGKNSIRAQVNGATKLLVHSNGGTSLGFGLTPPVNGLYVSGNVGIGTVNTSAYKFSVAGTALISNGLVVDYGGTYSTNRDGTGIEGNGNTSYGSGIFGSGYYGVYGYSSTSLGTGVYGTGYYGVYGSSSIGYAGFFDGYVYCNSTYLGSDRKLKQNITDIASAIGIIGRLQPKEYEYRHDGNLKKMNLPQGRHYGLIAQEVEAVLPNLIKETQYHSRELQPRSSMNTVNTTKPKDIIDFKALNYVELIPILIKGMQEQQMQIDKQEQRNNELQEQINSLKEQVSALTYKRTNVDGNLNVLKQNIPNPVQVHTTIAYNLPIVSDEAWLTITDALGRTVKTIRLDPTRTTITLDAATLSSGVYSYSLVVDGKILQTLKMTVLK